MCGIVGIFSRKGGVSESLDGALELLRHRGPDNRAAWSDGYVSLGHTRLSILDLSSRGHQPMSYGNDRFRITYNGEIYNYLEIREDLCKLGHRFRSSSDTEVLLAAYAEWGADCLGRLRGMFAFGVWDSRERSLFLARDRVGEKPLFFRAGPGNIYFASELKALVSLLPVVPEPDPAAIDSYLHYQYVPEPKTLFAGVMKLPAGHYMRLSVDDWQATPRRYWHLDDVEPIHGRAEELIRHELDCAIDLTLRSDVSIGIALSGGMDSGAIAALAAPRYKDTMKAFCVGYADRPEHDERAYARATADVLGLPFYETELKSKEFVDFFPNLVAAVDEPIADIAAYGHYSVMRLAADHGIKVMLSGLGGDELFWGYPWVIKAVELSMLKRKRLASPLPPQWLLKILEEVTSLSLYGRAAASRRLPGSLRSLLEKSREFTSLALTHPERAVFYNLAPYFLRALQYRKRLYSGNFRKEVSRDNPFLPFTMDLSAEDDIPLGICRLLFDTWLASNCLSLGDHVSMASSVELRLPLLDHRLIETVMGLRRAQPDHRKGHKFWLRQVLRNVVPKELLSRPKMGFQPPVQEWCGALMKKYGEYLRDGYLVRSGMLDKHALWKMMEEDKSRRQHTFMLVRLLILEIWHQKVSAK